MRLSPCSSQSTRCSSVQTSASIWILSMDYHALQAVIGAYCGIMEIIKERTEVVHECLRNPPNLNPQALYELSFLEFRMICELIALGCLVAHGDIKETKTKKLQSQTYN